MAYRFSQEEKQQFYQAIKQIQITDYAAALGYTLVRKGHYITLKEHDSIRIDPEKNCFWRNSGLGDHTSGSVIDFAMNVNKMSLSEVLPELENFLGLENTNYNLQNKKMKYNKHNTNTVKNKNLELPEAADNMRRVFAYLIKTRCIESEIVQAFVNEKMLYQDRKGNCVFVSKEDGEPVFACKRGTNTEKKFIGDVPGCDYEKGFYIHHGADETIVTESVIDAMSVMSLLHQEQKDYHSYNFAILAGVEKEESLLYQLKQHPVFKLTLALDNDAAGKTASERIQRKVKEECSIQRIKEIYPNEKDWNEELQKKTEMTHQQEKTLQGTSKDFFRSKAAKKYQGGIYENTLGIEH